MNNLDRLQTLARGLLDQTHNRQVRWERLAQADFILRLESASVIVSSVDGDGYRPYAFLVLDSSDEIVEKFQFDSEDDFDAEESLLDDLVVDLYAAARRNALQVDEVLDGLMNELGLE